MYKKIFLDIALLIALAVCGAFIVFAEETTTGTGDTANACAKSMVDNGYVAVTAYEKFLEEFFRVDVPSSEQMESAMIMYRATKDSIDTIYVESLNINSAEDLKTAAEEAIVCSEKRDEYLEYIKVLLQRYLLGSSTSKTTFEIVDGLKAMNADIEDLSEVFHSTFPKLFNQMDSNLYCYARQCLTQ